MGAVRAVCAPCERGAPLASARIALCIFGKKGEKAVANVSPIDDVAAVVALHQELPHRIGHPIRGPKVGKEKTRYSRAHSDWELVMVAQELLYRLADMCWTR